MACTTSCATFRNIPNWTAVCDAHGVEVFIVKRPAGHARTCLVVEQEGLIRVLHELMEAEHGIVRLHNGIGHFGRGNHRERLHDSLAIRQLDIQH